ncbi:MAG: hypothetical protein VYC42_18800 [Pseudomonadota bacterium]|nr:hypothetical protein [Pseudomonadota bacterium]
MDATTAQASVADAGQEALQRMQSAALDALWAQLAAPCAGELAGDYPGAVLTGAGFDSLPRLLGLLVRRIAAWLWRAKSFSGERGINLWWSPFGLLRRAPYRVGIEPAAVGVGDALVLDYDLAANPHPARRVRGELRRLGADHYLGRMLLRGASGYRLVTYFTLHRVVAGA